MQPYQIDLFRMSMFLVACMFAGAVPSAWRLRDVQGPASLIVGFVAMVLMTFGVVIAAGTDNVLCIAAACVLFGAAQGTVIGPFVAAVTTGKRRAAEAVVLTIGLVAFSAVLAAGFAMFSGFNMQSLGGILFLLLILLLVATIAWVFVRQDRIRELIFAALASALWMVYLIYDFNAIAYRYTEANWKAAAEIAMNVYLDMLNLFIRLLPYIVDLLDALD